MVSKLFTDEEGRQLSVFLNTANKCYIECKTDAESEYFSGFVTLDKEDVIELIKELQYIYTQME